MEKQILAIVSGKGGVGKTTIASNIGVYEALLKKEVVIIDLDYYNPSVAFHLGLMHSSVGIKKILNGEIAQIHEALIVHPPTGLRCIFPALTEDERIQIKKFYKLIKKIEYETVILDCPPGLPPVVREVVGLATDIIILMTPDSPSVSAALKITNIIKKFGKKNQKIRYVLNRVSGRPYELKKHEVEKLLGSEIFEAIPEDENIPRSIAEKIPILISYKGSPASKAMERMQKKLYSHGIAIKMMEKNIEKSLSFFSQIYKLIKKIFR